MDISEDESHDDLDSPQHLGYMESNTMLYQGSQILLTVGSSKCTSISMIKLNGITSTSIFLLPTRFISTVSPQSYNYYCVSTTISTSLST